MASKWKMALASAAIAILLTVLWLKIAPPKLIRIAANYSAKIVCTNVFLIGRDANEVLKVDVQAPGHPLLKLIQVDIDIDKRLVRANIFGLFGRGLAVYRSGTGCAAVPDGDIAEAKKYQFIPSKIPPPSNDQDWPLGSKAVINERIERIIQDNQLAGPGMRGIVVIHRGKLIAQRYDQGFNERTPLIGWSMTQTVNAALVGMQIKRGKLKLDQAGFWPTSQPPDGREKITLVDLLTMSSGLQFTEDYDNVSDVTRMLFLTPDMSAFAYSKPLEHTVGTFWNYSTGTSVLLSRLWQEKAGNQALTFPHNQLFARLGMSSAFIEADERGTFVGGSYMYATAQDWARFGQFLLQDGYWNGQQLLPDHFVTMMRTVAPTSHTPISSDVYWIQGHDGQTMAIIPSKQLVLVRLGLTPHQTLYKPQAMLAEIIQALE